MLYEKYKIINRNCFNFTLRIKIYLNAYNFTSIKYFERIFSIILQFLWQFNFKVPASFMLQIIHPKYISISMNRRLKYSLNVRKLKC